MKAIRSQANEKIICHFIGDIGLNGPFCDPETHASLRENMVRLARTFGECDLRIGNWE